MEFEEYYDLVKEEIRRLEVVNGFEPTAEPDRDNEMGVKLDYEQGVTPEESAEVFFNDWYLE